MRQAASWGLAAAVGFVAVTMVLGHGTPRGGEARSLLATAPPLGAAQSFAVLAAAGVTNTGPTEVTGDLGTHPTAAVTGFFGTTSNEGPGTVTGQIHQADAAALSARSALTTAYNNAAGQPTDFAVGTELGGQTLVAGTYASGTFGITAGAGPLTLSGDADDIWIFKAASTLTTSGASEVRLSGGAQACNVFWQIGSSATLGATSTFQGTIMAHTSISVGNNATVVGRLLAGAVADSGAVTLDDDTVAVSQCALAPATPTATTVPATATPTATVPPAPVGATSTPTLAPATATAVAATATAVAATATAVASTATPTATLAPATATAVAATATSIAATATAVAPAAATATTVAATATAVAATATAAAPSAPVPATSTPTPVPEITLDTGQRVETPPALPRAGGPWLPLAAPAAAGLGLAGIGWFLSRRRR